MNCIIVDDESPSREELKYFINSFSSINILNEFDNGVDVLKYIEENNVDIIFLDINMPNLDGVSLGKIISKFENKPKIVFITAYKEHAIEAFEIEAFDYILKPYSEDRIVTTLKKLEKLEFNDEKKCRCDRITLWKGEKMIVINIEDIYYCMANERETLVYTKEEEYIVNMSISEFFNKLPKENFFRSHRSYILNMNKIKEIIPWFNNTYNIKLEDLDIEIPVSRKNIKEFKHIMGI
ncbi:LytR/AlgR family response regulator transcription factor [Tepidibacter formicigenes]|jgi:two-component system LytT family response regulator|uniref:Stage 0 sporulation protein A homolog n=1 Tax=Tepidibacter formicigenes DSM 15518 TaxID=1123349 RepID=A0A1M6QNY8_9FIRM|nr:LytTR family DNA-binding domain-containing protein [Tepidibacter formicigenes]SHK21936.1 two component transcriptional regulator, LytTR family [Tepidibacter formicigenes DSM 15518]